MTPRVTVLDYEMSNLRSVSKALERLGAEITIARAPGDVEQPDAVVLPGVGHFGEAMRRIREQGLDEAIDEACAHEVPLLGICLGLQLLFEQSEEAPGVDGLGLLRGGVQRLRTDRKLPQIGWNAVGWRDALLAPDSPDPGVATYYFVHAYAVVPEDDDGVLGSATYGEEFCAAAGSGRIMGVQFHPEKSSAAGLALLDRWLAWVRRGAGVPA